MQSRVIHNPASSAPSRNGSIHTARCDLADARRGSASRERLQRWFSTRAYRENLYRGMRPGSKVTTPTWPASAELRENLSGMSIGRSLSVLASETRKNGEMRASFMPVELASDSEFSDTWAVRM
jgi:hypothetical protein